MNHPPLKRHPSLAPLSREHMSGLVQSRRLNQAVGSTPRECRIALAAFTEAWSTELAPHFDDEEQLLIPFASGSERERLLSEHAELRALAEQAEATLSTAGSGAGLCLRLSTLLRDHIRWEERVLFPAIEARAGSAGLAALAMHAARIEHDRPGSRPRIRLGDLCPRRASVQERGNP